MRLWPIYGGRFLRGCISCEATPAEREDAQYQTNHVILLSLIKSNSTNFFFGFFRKKIKNSDNYCLNRKYTYL
jgi:hypothetical protein